MNCRHDALGTRLWRSGFHNKLDLFGVIRAVRSDRTGSENNSWRILSGGGLSRPFKKVCSPRESTRPTRFLRKSACIVGPVPSPGGFFNGLLALSMQSEAPLTLILSPFRA